MHQTLQFVEIVWSVIMLYSCFEPYYLKKATQIILFDSYIDKILNGHFNGENKLNGNFNCYP